MQNIYHKGPHSRTMSINTQYLILFRNSRDVQQIETLARQVFGKDSSQFMKHYREQTSKPFGFVVLDLHPSTPTDKRIVRNFEPKLVAQPLATKSATERLHDLQFKINYPIGNELQKAEKIYLEKQNDPDTNPLELSNLRNEYHYWLEKFKKSQRWNFTQPSLPLKKKKSTDVLRSNSSQVSNKDEQKDLIDFSTPVDQQKSDDKSNRSEFVKTYSPSNRDRESGNKEKWSEFFKNYTTPKNEEEKFKYSSLQHPFGIPPGIPEDQISVSSENVGSKRRAEDVVLTPSNSDVDSEAEENLVGENSEFLSYDDTKEERNAKHNYIDRMRMGSSPIPDERINDKDTDRNLFSYDDTPEEAQKKRNYVRKYNLRSRVPLNYPREYKGVSTITDDEVESSDEELTRTMTL